MSGGDGLMGADECCGRHGLSLAYADVDRSPYTSAFRT